MDVPTREAPLQPPLRHVGGPHAAALVWSFALKASALSPCCFCPGKFPFFGGFSQKTASVGVVTGPGAIRFFLHRKPVLQLQLVAKCPRQSKIRSRSVRPSSEAKRPRRAKPQRRGEERRPRSIGSPPPAPPRPLPPFAIARNEKRPSSHRHRWSLRTSGRAEREKP